MAASLTSREIVRLRLASQFLIARGPHTAHDVVQTLGAVQSQDYAGAMWGVAQRMTGSPTDDVIEAELSSGRILRTHVLRPTWHFVTAADIRWLLALTAPRVKAAMAFQRRSLGLTEAVLRRGNRAIERALRDGKELTRPELGQTLARARVSVPTGQHLAHVMMNAELDALVCSGARRGKQFTYALLDERVPAAPSLDRDEALLALASRYFGTRGPASVNDFSWWSGLTVADAKRAVAMMGSGLEKTASGDRELWMVSGVAMPRKATAHLLPNYDEYFIGHRDRSFIGERLGHVNPVTGGDARIAHVAFIDGQLVGEWRRTAEAGRVVVTLTLHTRITPAETKRLRAEIDRLQHFLGATTETRIVSGTS